MDSLKRNGLNIKPNPIQPRNTTLGANNNVLTPNKLKTSRLITNNLYNEQRQNRVQNINTGNNSINRGWNTRG